MSTLLAVSDVHVVACALQSESQASLVTCPLFVCVKQLLIPF